MIVRCSGSKIQLYIDWGIFFQSDDAQLLTRIDNKKEVKSSWRVSDSETTSHTTDTIKFIESLFGKDKLFVQAVPNGVSPIDITFTITGLDEAIEPLRKACQWQ